MDSSPWKSLNMIYFLTNRYDRKLVNVGWKHGRLVNKNIITLDQLEMRVTSFPANRVLQAA